MSVKIKLEYEFFVFLYAYMRQIDLSLDRARWGPWSELKEYYQSQFWPVIVAEQLLRISNLKPEATPEVCSVEVPSTLKRIKNVFFRLIRKKQYLKKDEVLYCYQLLQRFDLLLNHFFSEYPLVAEKLRIDIAKFYSYILEPKLSLKDYFRTMGVEHFLQNPNNEVVKIDSFAKDLLLYKGLGTSADIE